MFIDTRGSGRIVSLLEVMSVADDLAWLGARLVSEGGRAALKHSVVSQIASIRISWQRGQVIIR